MGSVRGNETNLSLEKKERCSRDLSTRHFMKFYETIDRYVDTNINLYVDMDGVIAEYDIGNFDYNTIRPLKSNIKRIKDLLDKGINVKILTICKNNKIVEEKINWMKKHMSFFDIKNIIFISKEEEKYNGFSSKELKSNYLKNHIQNDCTNIVIDDDNSIIKYLIKNNKDVIVFQISSWID